MKPWEFLISTGLGVLCLLLAIIVIYFANSNRAFTIEVNEKLAEKRQVVQTELKVQEAVIQQGRFSQQKTPALARDVAQVAVAKKNTALLELLKKYNYKVNVKQNPQTENPSETTTKPTP